jgi:alpha-tubulin suppressor-like RCC1 family protein
VTRPSSEEAPEAPPSPPEATPEPPPPPRLVAVPERTDLPASTSGVTPTEISVGPGHACVRMSDDTARCWGSENQYGELGSGAAGRSRVPVRIEAPEGIVEIGAGQHFTCIRLRTRKIRCVGWNPYGQLGNGRSGEHEVSWQDVIGVEEAVELAVGDAYACAVLADGTVRCWGRNENGELGDGTREPRATAVRVRDLGGVVQLEVDDFACARRVDGSVHCWGTNHGETATPVAALEGSVDLTVAPFLGLALMADGTVRAWGENASGQLGIDPFAVTPGPTPLRTRAAPEPVAGLAGVTGIAAGGKHACAIVAGGRVMCWGAEWGHPRFPAACLRDTRNPSGPHGGGSARQWRYCPEPTAVAGLSGIVEIDASGEQTCARSERGAVRCWSPLRAPVAF